MNILIVDDDPDLVGLAKRWLEREGHKVAHAATGPEALAALAAGTLPGLVLLDVMLPKVDGFALLKQIRAEERLRKLPVVMISSFTRDKDVQRGMELGADDYIVKPLMEYHFLGRIERFTKPRQEKK